MSLFRKFLSATAIIWFLFADGALLCPDGEIDKGSGCQECENGTFKSGNMPVCQTFKKCLYPQVIDFPGNSTHNVVCHCNDTRFPVVDGEKCFPNKSCDAGYYFANASCVKCLNGTFKNTTGPDECVTCTECNETLHECSATMDAICAKPNEFDLTTTTTSVVAEGSAVSGNLSTGKIVGIVVGSVFGVIAVILSVFLVVKYIRSSKQNPTSRSAAKASNNHDVPDSAKRLMKSTSQNATTTSSTQPPTLCTITFRCCICCTHDSPSANHDSERVESICLSTIQDTDTSRRT